MHGTTNLTPPSILLRPLNCTSHSELLLIFSNNYGTAFDMQEGCDCLHTFQVAARPFLAEENLGCQVKDGIHSDMLNKAG